MSDPVGTARALRFIRMMQRACHITAMVLKATTTRAAPYGGYVGVVSFEEAPVRAFGLSFDPE
jgi:hypothetical protein